MIDGRAWRCVFAEQRRGSGGRLRREGIWEVGVGRDGIDGKRGSLSVACLHLT